MIELKNIQFSYPGATFKVTLDSLLLEAGVYALIGANGSGKTTMMRIINGLLTPTSGKIVVHGSEEESIAKSRLKIFSHNAYSSINPMLTVKQDLAFVSSLYGHQVNGHVIQQCASELNCTQILDKKVKQLSAGQQHKALLLRLMIVDPDIVLLDEPTTGLDVSAIESVLTLIDMLKQKGKVVIVSTHHPYELQVLKPQLLVMKEGALHVHDSSELTSLSVSQMRSGFQKLIGYEETANEY